VLGLPPEGEVLGALRQLGEDALHGLLLALELLLLAHRVMGRDVSMGATIAAGGRLSLQRRK
jgi:hypothetical protein